MVAGKDGWEVPEVMERRGARGVARWVSLRRNCRERVVLLALVEEGLMRPVLLMPKAGVVGVWGDEGVRGVLEAIVSGNQLGIEGEADNWRIEQLNGAHWAFQGCVIVRTN